MIYTVTLNPALDYYCTVETLNLGETNRCITESLIGGGKGINVSLMLAQLGVPTTALGFAAGFTGEELIRQLQDQSVNADFIRCAQGQTRINVKINSGVETEINGRGPEVSAAEREALLDRIRRIQPGDTLVLSGNVPPTLPESIYEQILAELPASSIRVVVDAEGALLRDTLRFHPFLIKPNLAELHQLVANPQAPVSDQIQELRQQGGEAYPRVDGGGRFSSLYSGGRRLSAASAAGSDRQHRWGWRFHGRGLSGFARKSCLHTGRQSALGGRLRYRNGVQPRNRPERTGRSLAGSDSDRKSNIILER